jgi:transcriptional regulator with XRE-family HTH domain
VSTLVTLRDRKTLVAAMRTRRFSQRSLAHESGASPQHINQLCTGERRRTNVALAGRIETALGMDRGALFVLDITPEAAAYLPQAVTNG